MSQEFLSLFTENSTLWLSNYGLLEWNICCVGASVNVQALFKLPVFFQLHRYLLILKIRTYTLNVSACEPFTKVSALNVLKLALEIIFLKDKNFHFIKIVLLLLDPVRKFVEWKVNLHFVNTTITNNITSWIMESFLKIRLLGSEFSRENLPYVVMRFM